MTTLSGLPRQELINLIQRLARERNSARRAAAHWHGLVREDLDIDPDRTRRDADAILALLGRDPDYLEHRRTLLAALPDVPTPPLRPRRSGPRCAKGFKPCGKPLGPEGLCSRHDYKTIRALRRAAAKGSAA